MNNPNPQPETAAQSQNPRYTRADGTPVIFANRTQAANKAAQLGEGWHVKQSPASRRFYVEYFGEKLYKIAPELSRTKGAFYLAAWVTEVEAAQ